MSFEDLLKNPEIEKIIGNISGEMIERINYAPSQCKIFKGSHTNLTESNAFTFNINNEARKQLPNIIDNPVQLVTDKPFDSEVDERRYFKQRNMGIVFSGGPAPGGHNVIAGIFDAAKKANPESIVYGFLVGPDGLIENEAVVIDSELVDSYRNLGGFTMIKTGRTKIDTKEKMNRLRDTCQKLNVDSVVVIGGDDSNTNAAFMAQELYDDGIQIIGVPKTIDGDIQVRTADGEVLCAMSFGFHSAARAYSRSISNLCNDCSSDIKYWHICKVMGRVASHLALEVGLQTHANMTLIGEDLADYVDEERVRRAEEKGEIDYTAYGMTLRHLSRRICEAIVKRAQVGKNYGVIVIPEGVLEFINEIQVFIIKLNAIITEYNEIHDIDFHAAFPRLENKLDYLRKCARGIQHDTGFPIWNSRDDELFNDIPDFFQEGLLTERDSHGNFQFSQVETEKIILGLVSNYLSILKEKGLYRVGIKNSWYQKVMNKGGLDPDYYGEAIFENYGQCQFLLLKESIISMKTLKNELVKQGIRVADDPIPEPVASVYRKSVPSFKTQTHFYGYDGRGSDPTRFDCDCTYNLGLTVFSLIANGATGQMATIKNLELDFSMWEPIGIPIAPLMHLEERKGKMILVIEKSLVDVQSNAFKVIDKMKEKWLAAEDGPDCYRRPGPVRFTGKTEEDRPITLILNSMGR